MNYSKWFSDQIKISQDAIVAQKIVIACLWLFAAAIMAFLPLFIDFGSKTVEEITKFGSGVFFAGISTFPIKEIYNKRSTINTYTHFKRAFESQNNNSHDYDMIVQAAIDAMKETMKR